jgi:hypothetical protein
VRSATLSIAGGLLALSLGVAACSSGSTTTGSPVGAVAATTSVAGSTAVATTPATASTPKTSAVAGSAGGTVDVCSLLSSAQASSANSVTYGAAVPKHLAAGYDACTYTNTGKHPDPIDIQNLTVSVISLPGCYDQLKSTNGPGKTITGVGDAAFGYEIGMLVNDNGRCVQIEGLTHAELGGNYGPDTAMAKIVLAGLH